MPRFRIEPHDRELNTPYAVYGNAAANDCLEAIDAGHVCRLIIGAGERTFVADHVRLTDGRIAMATSKGTRTLLEATEAEFGYGVAKARAYVYLPFDYSLFATDLETPQFGSDGIEPAELRPVSFEQERELVTDGGTNCSSGTEQRDEAIVRVEIKETRVGNLAVRSEVDGPSGLRGPTDAERKASELHNKILDRIDESAYSSGDVIADIHVPRSDDPWIDWNDEVVSAAGNDAHVAADGGTERCDYCDDTELVYELSVRGGSKFRCVECLAIEQGQQQFSLPFERWLDQDELEGPGIEPFDPREHDYKTLRSWFKILARIKDDDPIIKRDPDATGTVFEDTREFLINVMGADAHKRPSELRSQDTDTEHPEDTQ